MSAHENLVQREVKSSSEKSFAITFSAVFALITIVPLIKRGEVKWPFLVASIVFLLIAFVRPQIVAPLNKLWFKFGLLLHRITNPIVMGIIFFGVLTPMGMWRRVRKKTDNAFALNWESQSSWMPREQIRSTKDTFKQQF